MAKEYKIREGQSLTDVAIQLFGSTEKLAQLIYDNPQLGSLENDNPAGLTVTYEDPEDTAVTDFLATERVTVSTLLPAEITHSYSSAFNLTQFK
jgi:hypothetical protein